MSHNRIHKAGFNSPDTICRCFAKGYGRYISLIIGDNKCYIYLYEDYSGTWQYKNKHLSADKIKITGRILEKINNNNLATSSRGV